MVVKYTLFIAFFVATQVTSPTIVFYGDSITAGYGLSLEQAYPAIVKHNLDEKGKSCQIINAGLSGETSAGGLARIDWVLKQPVDIFVLELGANDGLRGLPLEQTEKNLQAIIDKVKAKNPKTKIVIAGMKVPPNLGPDYTKKFDRLFLRLAEKNNADLIPFLLQGVAGDKNLNQADGIHPNIKGHQLIGNQITPLIEKLIISP